MEKSEQIDQNNGDEEIKLTEEEFENAVDVFRTLLKWDQDLKQKELDENIAPKNGTVKGSNTEVC